MPGSRLVLLALVCLAAGAPALAGKRYQTLKQARSTLEATHAELLERNRSLRTDLNIPPAQVAPVATTKARVFKSHALASDNQLLEAMNRDLDGENQDLEAFKVWRGSGSGAVDVTDAIERGRLNAGALRVLHLTRGLEGLANFMRVHGYRALRLPGIELEPAKSIWVPTATIQRGLAIVDGRLRTASQRIGMGWYEDHRFGPIPEIVPHALGPEAMREALFTLSRDAVFMPDSEFAKTYVLHQEIDSEGGW